MRIITIPMYPHFQPEYISFLKSIPFGATYRDIHQAFEDAGEDFPQYKNESPYPHNNRTLISNSLCKTANIIAVYDHKEDMYFVCKNRYTVIEGWFSKEDFNLLVMKEMGK